MPTKVTQIEPDGTDVSDFDPDQVPFEDQEGIIQQGLQARGWAVTFLQADKSTKRRLFKMEKGDQKHEVITYIFSNLSWSSGGRSHNEKRIQLSRPYDEHAADFNLPKSASPRCALMGIYRRKGIILFCAWDASAYIEHSNPNSCYVKTEAMAAAARTGFGQSIDAKKRLVCVFTPDLLAYYLNNMSFLHENVVVSEELVLPDPEASDSGRPDEKFSLEINAVDQDVAHNIIFYGAPGTGKSYNLEQRLQRYFPDEALYERTTFSPDYTSSNFIGTYKPSPIYRQTDDVFFESDRRQIAQSLEPIIDYRQISGPFLRMLTKAINNPEHNFCLVIEEINRGNAGAIFSDVFQMLDRDPSGSGTYSVTLPSDVQNFLAAHGHSGPVRMPPNLYIWATMNSADQGVFPIDSAFKRRWSMEYVGLDDGEEVVADWTIHLRFMHEPIKWNTFRKAVNGHLERQGIAEDRLIGPFFLKQFELDKPGAFEAKVIQYLRDDVVRTTPSKLFVGQSTSCGALIRAYQRGENIFVNEVDFRDG
ncbi:MAG: AAA family ATPase [Pseudomonadota bacterium]